MARRLLPLLAAIALLAGVIPATTALNASALAQMGPCGQTAEPFYSNGWVDRNSGTSTQMLGFTTSDPNIFMLCISALARGPQLSALGLTDRVAVGAGTYDSRFPAQVEVISTTPAEAMFAPTAYAPRMINLVTWPSQHQQLETLLRVYFDATQPERVAEVFNGNGANQEQAYLLMPFPGAPTDPEPFLSLEMETSVAPATIAGGQETELSFTVRNSGTLTTSGTLRWSVPEGLAILRALDGGAATEGTATWQVSSLAPGAESTKRVMIIKPAPPYPVPANSPPQLFALPGATYLESGGESFTGPPVTLTVTAGPPPPQMRERIWLPKVNR